MDRWINHIAETDADPDLRYAEESHPWKSGILNLGDPELRATADAASVSVSNPLEHVDVHSGGLYIWRVKNGAAVHWRHENYRIFYEKDSFIVLNIRGSRMTGDKPEYALHLWLGKRLSPEDYRLAAYRASLINSSLQYEAVIYREPQGKETSVFRGYFRYLTYLKGSADDDYWEIRMSRGIHPTRLLKICKPDPSQALYRVTEVPARHNQLNSSYVYIMDRGNTLIQWSGELCKNDDVLQAIKFMESVKSSRGGSVKVEVINDNGTEQEGHQFYQLLSRSSYMHVADDDEDQQRTLSFPTSQRGSTAPGPKGKLYQVVVKPNMSPYYKLMKEGNLNTKDLSKETLYIMDLEKVCILWYKQSVPATDKFFALDVVQYFLSSTSHPDIAVLVLTDGQSSPVFTKLIPRK